MEINSVYVGTTLKPYHGIVQWRDTMNYAAALSDDNPYYFDDERPDALLVGSIRHHSDCHGPAKTLAEDNDPVRVNSRLSTKGFQGRLGIDMDPRY